MKFREVKPVTISIDNFVYFNPDILIISQTNPHLSEYIECTYWNMQFILFSLNPVSIQMGSGFIAIQRKKNTQEDYKVLNQQWENSGV